MRKFQLTELIIYDQEWWDSLEEEPFKIGDIFYYSNQTPEGWQTMADYPWLDDENYSGSGCLMEDYTHLYLKFYLKMLNEENIEGEYSIIYENLEGKEIVETYKWEKEALERDNYLLKNHLTKKVTLDF